MSNQGNPSGNIKHLHISGVDYGSPRIIEDHRNTLPLRQPVDISNDDAVLGRVDSVGNPAVPVGSKVIAITGRSVPVLWEHDYLGYEEGLLTRSFVVPEEPAEGYTLVTEVNTEGIFRFPRGSGTIASGGEPGMSGQTTKTFLPDGNRWLPNSTEIPLKCVWTTYGFEDHTYGVESDYIGWSGGEDRPGSSLSFKRTMRSRFKKSNGQYYTVDEQTDNYKSHSTSPMFVGNKHAGYDAVKFEVTVPDKYARGALFFIEYDWEFYLENPDDPWDYMYAEDYLSWALNRPFYWNWAIYQNTYVAPLENERRYYRCVITDQGSSSVQSSDAWMVYSTRTISETVPLISQPIDMTVHAGEVASTVFRHHSIALGTYALYYRWRRRPTPSDSWEWLTDSRIKWPTVSKIMPPDQEDPDNTWSEQWQCVVSTTNLQESDPNADYGNKSSDVITVTVLGQSDTTPLAVTSPPVNALGYANDRFGAAFAVSATGKGLSYQWQTRLGDGTNPGDTPWEDVVDATLPILEVDPAWGDSAFYRFAKQYTSASSGTNRRIFWVFRRTFGEPYGPEFTAWTFPSGLSVLSVFTAVDYGTNIPTGEGDLSYFTETDDPVPAPTYAPFRYYRDDYEYEDSWFNPQRGLWADDDASYDGAIRVWQKPYDYGDTAGDWPLDPSSSQIYWRIPAFGDLTGPVSVLLDITVLDIGDYWGSPYRLDWWEEYVTSEGEPYQASADGIWNHYLDEWDIAVYDSPLMKDKFRNFYSPTIFSEIHLSAWRVFYAASPAFPLNKPDVGHMDHLVVGSDFYVDEWGSLYSYDLDTEMQLTPFSYSQGPGEGCSYGFWGVNHPFPIHAMLSYSATFSRRKDIPLPFAVSSADGGVIPGGVPTVINY